MLYRSNCNQKDALTVILALYKLAARESKYGILAQMTTIYLKSTNEIASLEDQRRWLKERTISELENSKSWTIVSATTAAHLANIRKHKVIVGKYHSGEMKDQLKAERTEKANREYACRAKSLSESSAVEHEALRMQNWAWEMASSRDSSLTDPFAMDIREAGLPETISPRTSMNESR